MNTLIELDHRVTLWLNHLGSERWDGFWLWITERSTWIPLYAIIIVLFFVLERRRGWIPLVCALACVGLSDLVSVHGFKEVFERLRPCHDPAIVELLRLVPENCGGRYGFVSSHAANGFSMAVFFGAYFGRHWKPTVPVFFVWGTLLAYSRVYLGVHFLGDILGGAILGSVIGWGTWRIYRKTLFRFVDKAPQSRFH